VRGDGRTALKIGLNKYLRPYTNGIAVNFNPQASVVGSANRTWNDRTPCGNPAGPASGACQASYYVPNCNLLNPLANGDCGPTSPNTFGTQVQTSFVDPSFLRGWGSRDTSNWQTNVAIQQDFKSGLSATAGYYRRWYTNLMVTDNTLVTPADYSPYCVTAPSDSRLGSVSGSQICNLFDLNSNKFGQVSNLYTYASNYGNKTDVYNGLDLLAQWRMPHGGFISGGVSYGNERVDQCDLASKTINLTAAAPNAGYVTRFCNTATNPFWQPNAKISATYPIPYGFQASLAFQSIPGPPISATATFTNAQIAPSLGRNLSAGATATTQVALIEPGTVFGDRLNQVDVRLGKKMKFGRMTAEGDLDVYNLFNANPVLAVNTVFGSSWLTPLNILGGRLFKLGFRVAF
jgi:hypothetical protein